MVTCKWKQKNEYNRNIWGYIVKCISPIAECDFLNISGFDELLIYKITFLLESLQISKQYSFTQYTKAIRTFGVIFAVLFHPVIQALFF